MNKSVSFLLGAGFSANMGYPIGNKLSDLLLTDKGSNYTFSANGSIVDGREGKPSMGMNGYRTSFEMAAEFCRELMQYFDSLHNGFDYEAFYDYLKGPAETDSGCIEISKKYINEFTHGNIHQLIYTSINVFNQMAARYIVDGSGNKFYDNAIHTASIPGYDGILQLLHSLGESYIVNIHTLNHDLLFERFNITDQINGQLCDGFEEMGSPYYGKLQFTESGHYKCRLARYTGNYNKRFRLFKLHGSLDYTIFSASNGSTEATPESYLKIRPGVGFGELYKEYQNEAGELIYDHSWYEYHADFLTGTTAKIGRYSEHLLYKKLFDHYKANLEHAEMLIIIGYGGRDTEVNKMIVERFKDSGKKVWIIDPFPGSDIKLLAEQINATILETSVSDLPRDTFPGLYNPASM